MGELSIQVTLNQPVGSNELTILISGTRDLRHNSRYSDVINNLYEYIVMDICI